MAYLETGGAAGITAVNLSAGTTSNNLTAFTMSNSNGVSFGLNGSVITATVATNYLTTAMLSNAVTLSNIKVSAGTLSALRSDISFNNSNGVSFGLETNGIVTATVQTNYLTTAALSNHSHGVSFTSGSTVFQTLSFTNSNGISFNSGTQGVFGSHNGITSQTNQTIGVYMSSNTTSSVSSGTLDARSMTFRGAGVASVGYSGGEVVISVPAGGGGITNINISAGTTSQNLSNVVFSNSNGVTFGLNGSTVTASVAAAGGGATLSNWDPYDNRMFVAAAWDQARLFIKQLPLPAAVQFDRVGIRMTHSNATNSSGSGTISVWIGVSTRNVSTLSSVGSTSFTTAFTRSGTVGSYSLFGGQKILPVPWTTTLTAGNYWVGIAQRSTTGGANMTFGHVVLSVMNSTASGYFGSASNATAGLRIAEGVYSATTAGMPVAISMTQVNGNSSAFHRPPAYLLMSSIF